MKTSYLNLLVPSAVASLSAMSASHANITLTDTTNITLANSQVESGDDLSDNPNVVTGSIGALLPYTVSGSFTCCGPNYVGNNLNDDDIGAGVPSDGTYAIPDNAPLTFAFAPGSMIGSIAIYNGYTNRDDGTYTLTDGVNTLGAYTITTAAGNNNGADSFFLRFNTPVTTNQLVLTPNVGAGDLNTSSFREIQVFAVPEPTTGLLGLAGTTLLGLRRRRG